MRDTRDRLQILGLEVMCVIGDLPEERCREQRLMVDVSLVCDLAAAAASDALSDTVDYAALAVKIRTALKEARCRMVERAAECVARVCLSEPRVQEIAVRVEKYGGVPGLRAAAVEIVRGKEGAAL
ncbi:MAG TPA: dihydroneopterin aldolase [Kiritimatiellia bacterium]|jgi:dihydroneopterin aldolase|nr:dihydroneopterin aldolase [Kiritimatiellia bacterium]HPS05935.1 dihydroneopterin aldolase [Kiritimatiellia bacterium]